MHKPRLIFGEGQGAVVATAYARPFCLEQVLWSRNVQPIELPEITSAWGNVAGVLIHEPKLSRRGVQLEKLQAAAPELFDTKFPVPARRLFGWKDAKSAHYNETKAFMLATGVELVTALGSVSLNQLVEEPATVMWEHDGRCPCGRRSFLFSQCSKCILEEAEQMRQEAEEAAKPPEEPSALPEEPTTAALELPSSLPHPRVRTGYETSKVIFVTDRQVSQILRREMTWQHGAVHIQKWLPGRDCTLAGGSKSGPVSSKDIGHAYTLEKSEGIQYLEHLRNKELFRMTFAQEANGDIMPVQQCVDIHTETMHTIGSEAWRRSPETLIGAWEMTPVTDQLNGHLTKARGSSEGQQVGSVIGPLRRFLLPVMSPFNQVWVFKTSSVKDPSRGLHERVHDFDERLGIPEKFVLFGFSAQSSRWLVILSGHWPMHPRNFHKAIDTDPRVPEISAWAITWGRDQKQDRTVISLFAEKSMV